MFFQICIWISLCVLSVNAFASESPKVIDVSVYKSYVPIGFDDNDRVEVTVAGSFPNTCYKVAPAETKVDEEKKLIQVWQKAYYYPGTCIEMMVAFSQVVNIGILKDGEYALQDGPTGRQLGMVSVVRSTHPGADDFLYAPIEDAFLIVDASGAKNLVLLGEFADRCTELADVKVHYYPEVLVVQPIARRTGVRCEPEKTRFQYTMELSPDLKGTYLLHVRSMNGAAINKLVDARFIE